MAFDYRNPVLRGDTPDPCVVRVGPDYDLATTTFEFHPGILIHSTELLRGRARLLAAEASEWFTAVRFALLAIGPADRPVTFTGLHHH